MVLRQTDYPANVGPVTHRRPRVLFVYPIEATFINTDMTLLNSFSSTIPLLFKGKSSYPTLLHGCAISDVAFCWFALGYAWAAGVVSRLLGRRSVVVSGGWDVESASDIGYGLLFTDWGRKRARHALRSSDRVLAFSGYSERKIRAVAPDCRVQTAYLGVDTQRFQPSTKEDIVVTTAHINRENLARKGLEHLVMAAKRIPGAKFYVVGRHQDSAIDRLRRMAGANTVFPGWIEDQELRNLLGRAKVYAQPSHTEGFGVAVAEAMSSGCVPVVTRAGALPEVVGDAGFYTTYGEVDQLVGSIEEAMASDIGPKARQRTERLFGLEQRRRTLHQVLMDLLDGSESI